MQCFVLGLDGLTIVSSAPSMESGQHANALMPRRCVHRLLISRANHTLWLSDLSQYSYVLCTHLGLGVGTNLALNFLISGGPF